MSDKLIHINQFLDNAGRFNIPLRTKSLLYYSKEQPQNIGPSLSFKVTFNLEINNQPVSFDKLSEEIEKIKNDNNSDDELLKKLQEKIKAKINYSKSISEEPSIIYLSLPISKPNSIREVDEPSYYPSYAGLTPNQRWIYLDWLQDISKPIPKGYLYIYYYGLERQLLESNNLDTIDELLYLSKYHEFIRINAHTAIFFSYFRNENRNILNKLFAEEVNYPINNLNLIFYYLMKKSLSSKDIYEVISQYSDINKRYLKLHPVLYLEELDNYILKNYEKQGFALYKYYKLNELSLVNKTVYLNYSFPDEIRNVEVINIIENKNFKKDILHIHKNIHEKVKKRLKVEKTQSKNMI